MAQVWANVGQARKKQLKFQRSKIHDWGLLALEPIDAEDFVIEYVGEIIRRQVLSLSRKCVKDLSIPQNHTLQTGSLQVLTTYYALIYLTQ